MKLKADPDTYIFPPRPNTAVPFEEAAFFAEVDWIWQYKVNDTRMMVKYLPDWADTDTQGIELWTRHAERPRSYHLPDWLAVQLKSVAHTIGLAPGELHLLDGGLMDAKHSAIKDTLVIWDILVRDGYQLLGTTYAERYDQIAIGTTPWCFSHDSYDKPVQFGMAYGEGPEWANVFHLINNPDPTPQESWTVVNNVNKPYIALGQGPLLEGMVFKDPDGRLEMGLKEKNNAEWQCRCRVQTGRHLF